MSQKILIIQTAFIGDIILATALIEKLSSFFPQAKIDFLLRKGNESLLENNPSLNATLIWDKKVGKYKHLFKLLKQIRKTKYDYVINLHRFASSGILAGFSNAKNKIGFDKNPMSFLFTKKVTHEYKKGLHEIDRNQKLIEEITDSKAAKPKLYPSDKDFEKIAGFTQRPFICMAPASVWFTKQLPLHQWINLIKLINKELKIYLIGGKADEALCQEIIEKSGRKEIENLSGKLSFLESAALMSKAKMNYANDSAPLHIASAMNAPVTAFFCSTVTDFGFFPLSDKSIVAEIDYPLYCRPCGLHGFKSCPEGHFKCAFDMGVGKYAITKLL